MKKTITRLFALVLIVSAGLLTNQPKVDAQVLSGFKYASIAYVGSEKKCSFVVTECSANKGNTCTTVGTKSRGLLYCWPF